MSTLESELGGFASFNSTVERNWKRAKEWEMDGGREGRTGEGERLRKMESCCFVSR